MYNSSIAKSYDANIHNMLQIIICCDFISAVSGDDIDHRSS